MQRIPWNVTHIGLWFVVSSPSLQNISTLAKQKGLATIPVFALNI